MKILNKNLNIKKGLAKIAHKIGIRQKPRVLYIEPTNLCNLNCPFCLVNIGKSATDRSHDSLKRETGFMDMGLFSKILRDAKDFGIKDIILEYWGEPFLHPNITDMITQSSVSGFKTRVYTNGLLIRKEHFDTIKKHIQKIIISIDGASEEIYKQNRIGGDFSLAFQNLLNLSKYCRGSQTKVVWQYLVMLNNEHEINKAKEIAKEHDLCIVFKTFNPSIESQITSKKDFRRRIKSKPCTYIYETIGVLWDGRVVPCCQDPEGLGVVGNINNNTLTEIWESDYYCKFRHQVDNVKNAPSDEPLICKTCQLFFPFTNN